MPFFQIRTTWQEKTIQRVNGFSVIEAKDIDDALSIARKKESTLNTDILVEGSFEVYPEND